MNIKTTQKTLGACEDRDGMQQTYFNATGFSDSDSSESMEQMRITISQSSHGMLYKINKSQADRQV